jgi:hypothetical protein
VERSYLAPRLIFDACGSYHKMPFFKLLKWSSILLTWPDLTRLALILLQRALPFWPQLPSSQSLLSSHYISKVKKHQFWKKNFLTIKFGCNEQKTSSEKCNFFHGKFAQVLPLWEKNILKGKNIKIEKSDCCNRLWFHFFESCLTFCNCQGRKLFNLITYYEVVWL